MSTTPAIWKSKLHHFRWGMRGAAAVRGIFYLLLISGLLLTVGCLIDGVLHTNSLSWRISFWIVWFVTTLVAGWYFLIRPFFSQLSDLQIALQIEKRTPELEGRLSTAIDLNQHKSVSPFYSLIVDDQVSSLWYQLRVWPLLNRQLLIYYLSGLLLLITAGTTLFTFAPHTVQHSFQRLMLPLSARPWPQQIQLLFLDEQNEYIQKEFPGATSGTVTTLNLINQNGALPDDLVIESLDSKTGDIKLHPYQVLSQHNARHEHDMAQFRLILPEQPISLRARGGDDQSMPWIPFPVRPALKFLSSDWRISYPAYLRTEPFTVTNTTPNLTLPVGSALQYSGKVTPHCSHVELHLNEEEPVLSQSKLDQSEINLKYQFTSPGRFKPSVTVSNPDSQQSCSLEQKIVIVADNPPQAAIIQPSPETTFSPDSTLSCDFSITDDWGIKSVKITLSRINSSKLLWEEHLTPQSGQTTISHKTTLPLTEMNLSTEDQLILTLTATDGHPAHDPVILTTKLRLTSNELLAEGLLDRFFELQHPLGKAITTLESPELSPHQKLKNLSTLFNSQQQGLLPKLTRLEKESHHHPARPLNMLLLITQSGLAACYDNQLAPLIAKENERQRTAEFNDGDTRTPEPESISAKLNALRSSLTSWHDFLKQWEPYHQTGKTFTEISVLQNSLLDKMKKANLSEPQRRISYLNQQSELLGQYDKWILETENIVHTEPGSSFAQFTPLLMKRPEFDAIPLAMENTIEALQTNNIQEASRSASAVTDHLDQLSNWYQNQLWTAIRPKKANSDQETTQPTETTTIPFPGLTSQMQQHLSDSNNKVPQGIPETNQNNSQTGGDPSAPRSQTSNSVNSNDQTESLLLPASEHKRWGDLPKRMQERLFKGNLQSTPPKYQEAVKRYFEQFSQQPAPDQ